MRGRVQLAQLKQELSTASRLYGQPLGSPWKTNIQAYNYKTLSVCPWPCGCADWYGGLKEDTWHHYVMLASQLP